MLASALLMNLNVLSITSWRFIPPTAWLLVTSILPRRSNLLLGVDVKMTTLAMDGERRYLFIERSIGDEELLIIWRSLDELDVPQDKKFVTSLYRVIHYDRVYVNHDSAIRSAGTLDSLFKRLFLERVSGVRLQDLWVETTRSSSTRIDIDAVDRVRKVVSGSSESPPQGRHGRALHRLTHAPRDGDDLNSLTSVRLDPAVMVA